MATPTKQSKPAGTSTGGGTTTTSDATTSKTSSLRGQSYDDQVAALTPSDGKTKPKTTPPSNDPNLLPAVMEAGTSESNLLVKSGEVTQYGFLKDRYYNLTISLPTLCKIGQAGGKFPAEYLKEDGVVSPANTDVLIVDGNGITEKGSFTFFLEQVPGKDKKPSTSTQLTVRAANNGLLCLLRLAGATRDTYTAMGPQVADKGMRALMKTSMGGSKKNEDSREQNFYASTGATNHNSRANSSYAHLMAAYMCAAGIGDQIASSQPIGSKYRGLKPADALAYMDSQLDLLWMDRGNTTFFSGKLGMGDFWDTQGKSKTEIGASTAACIEELAKRLKAGVSVDVIPAEFKTFKDQFLQTIGKAFDSALGSAGAGSPATRAQKTYNDLKQEVKTSTTTVVKGKTALDEHNNTEGGVK